MGEKSKYNPRKNTATSTMKLSVIIISYNSAHFLQTCLQPLIESLHQIPSEIFVVDNNSKDNSVILVRTLFLNVHLLANTKNLGFGAACNQALREAKGEYILILNPDVCVHPTTLSTMLSYLQNHQKIGILVPQLRFTDGSLQYSCRRYPVFLAHFIQRFFPNSQVVRSYLMLDKDHSVIQEIDWAIGAFLLVRREVFQQIGLFDERYFLYFEDTDLCRRTKNAGRSIVYYPKAVATHYFHQSSYKILSKPFFHHLRSMFIYYKTYGFKFR